MGTANYNDCKFEGTDVDEFPCVECARSITYDYYENAGREATDADFFWIGLVLGVLFSFAFMAAVNTIGW